MTDAYLELYSDLYSGSLTETPTPPPPPAPRDQATVRLVGANGQSITLLDTAEELMRAPGGAGWGMVPVANSWFEGAGDGARYRGTRRLMRELNIPISAFGKNRTGVEAQLRRLSNTIHDPFRVFMDYVDGRSYWIDAVYEAGASGQYGPNPARFNNLPIVLRCPDPYWTSVQSQTFTVKPALGDPLLPELAQLHISSSVAQGQVVVNNIGDVPSKPTWKITGPGSDLTIAHGGRGLKLNKTLLPEDVVHIAFVDGGWTITDQADVNLYPLLDPAPYFPEFPQGTSMVTVLMTDASPDTAIQVVFPERREMMY